MYDFSVASFTKARKTIFSLFSEPPASKEEFLLRVKGLDHAASRAVLIEVMRNSTEAEIPQEPMVMLAQFFKLGQEPNELLKLIQDDNIDQSLRVMPLMILLDTNPEALGADFLQLNPDLLNSLADNSNEIILNAATEDSEGAREYSKLLVQLDSENRGVVFDRLELTRRDNMAPAWMLFRDALQVSELQPFHKSMVELIVQETQVSGVDVWDDLLQGDLPRETRSLIQKQLMRWRTSLLNSKDLSKFVPAFTAPATAWICPCDGVGAYVVLVCVQLATGKINIHNVCMRTTGELRDGFAMTMVAEEEFERIRGLFEEQQGQEFVEFPLAKAFKLVSEARISPLNEKGVGMEETLEAAAWLQWAAAMATPEDTKSHLDTIAFPLPDSDFLPDNLDQIFNHPDCELWFLNEDDLLELGVDEEVPADIPPSWLNEQIVRANIPAVREKLQGMMRHMAWIFSWDDDLKMAGIVSCAVEMLDDEESAAPVIMHYLAKSIVLNRANEEMRGKPHHLEIGDRGTRENLRSVGFPRLSNPKGKHMAILDFSEAALMILDEVVGKYSQDRQPRQDVLPLIALAVGKAQAEMCLSGRSGFDLPKDVKRFRRMINAIVKVSNFDGDEAFALWSEIVPSLESFYLRVCSGCEVNCLQRPTGDMKEWFYSGDHPGFLGD